jgi:hypothetical protein
MKPVTTTMYCSLALMTGLVFLLEGCTTEMPAGPGYEQLAASFEHPPDSARPGVYWYFMDGNLSREQMTADLESMKEVGIGNLVFLEVNVGVPRGKVDFLSEEWQQLFTHAVREAERLGIVITIGVGPGWTGSGGPWVEPERSMLHLVATSTVLSGPGKAHVILPVPEPRRPFFGVEGLTPKMKEQWMGYHEDVRVLAFPSPTAAGEISDIDEKALYYRAPYSSQPGVKPYLPAPAGFPGMPDGAAIDPGKILDVSAYMQADGSFTWDVPEGNWTIMRFCTRNNGAVTRPAPEPGLGFECDKFNASTFDEHFDAFLGKLMARTGDPDKGMQGGWKFLHMDSWEMGAQNWTEGFLEAFRQRRGYDPLPFLPTYTGNIVGSLELSERFLWDLRMTSQELILENHAGRIKEIGKEHGFRLSIEPYDMNPTADLDLGSLADVPMCEFWSRGYGFNTSFSPFESSSIAHVLGRPVVAAEAFTAWHDEAWKMYPGAMKNQGDWAFCTGINRFVYHTFAHKPLGDHLRPGMTMGPYGVHWDRGQTWWSMSPDYHRYVTRCQYMLQQGRAVADVLYLTPEGAPHVFRPPRSALTGNDTIPDRKGYNFDGCSPLMLMSHASVRDGKIVFPGGASYEILVLPSFETMTPELLEKIASLIRDGATVVGQPPRKSPSLAGYPDCDRRIAELAGEIWGGPEVPDRMTGRSYGKGRIYTGGVLAGIAAGDIYPGYEATSSLLKQLGVEKDFQSSGSIRYTHRDLGDIQVYFVANRTDQKVRDECNFLTDRGKPELWDPITGEKRTLPEYDRNDGLTTIPLSFDPHQSFFIIFTEASTLEKAHDRSKNFPEMKPAMALDGPWKVGFDPAWGGPERVEFEELVDWTARPEKGIRYYSGLATYIKTFDMPESMDPGDHSDVYLNLGKVRVMARVILNGKDLGVVWTDPWQVKATDVIKPTGNQLEIQVINLWPNRLIGDEQLPDDGIKDGKWPEWLTEGKPRTSGRYTFTTHRFYQKDSPLLASGLIGPVTIQYSQFTR